VIFPNITGASATNSITINGNNNVIQFSPTTTDMAVVRFNNGDFYRLKNLIIRTTSVTVGWGIHFFNGSDDNIIDSCNIDITAVTSSIAANSAGIVWSASISTPTSSGTNGYRNIISNNIIRGNPIGSGMYYGIVGIPATASTIVSANKFYNNIIQDFFYAGVQWQFGNATSFDGNTIRRTTKTSMTTTYAFYLTGGGRQDTIKNNIVTDLFAGSPTTTLQCFGVYAINYTGQSFALPHVIDNNLFNFNTGTGAHYGLYMLSAFNFAVRNNTIAFHNTTVTGTSQTYGFYTSSGTSVGNAYDIRNNIFFNSRTSTTGQFYSYFISGAFTGNTLGKNSYFGSAASYRMANIGGLDYNTFAQYSAFMGIADNTSSDISPNFINPLTRNFSPQDGWFDGNGMAMPHINRDVTGATRTTPIDIGAYEASPIALDIAANSLNVPAAPYAAGVQNITATIRNGGTSTITSATINWTINGVAQTPVNFTGSLVAGSTSSPITLGTVNVQVGTIYDIAFMVSNPNNTTESNTTNNSASNRTACSLPGGVYTINQGAAASGTNFTSFTTPADLISLGGINGALTFNVVANSGPYNNQVFFRNVQGVSATNTITFNGNGNRVDFNNTNSSSIGIINVIGTDYITFNQLNIRSLNLSNGVGYLLTAGADYINILNCTIDISSVTGGSLSAGIAVTASLSSASSTGTNVGLFNRFIGNTILGNASGGPYFGISAMAHNTNGPNNGYVIKDNVIRDFTFYGIYAFGVTGSLFDNNDISRPTKASPTTFYGISCVTSSGDTFINNKITKPFEMLQTATSTFYGIDLGSSLAGRPVLVANNLITDIKGGGLMYGINLSSVSQIQVYHNTVSIDYPQATTASATYVLFTNGTPSFQRVRNNIFHVNRGGTGSKYLMYINTASTTAYDYRNNGLFYNVPAGSTNNFLGFYTSNRVDLAAWRAAIPTNQLDSFSVFANPNFRTAFTQAPFTPGNDSLNNIGSDIRAIVPRDINGTIHDSLPDPGAYKFDVSPNDAGLIGFSSPVMPLSIGTQNVNAVIRNFGSAALTSANIDWEVNGVSQTGTIWSGLLNTNDTVSAAIGVYNFATPGLYTLKAWSSSPNSSTDILRFNDTIQQTFCTPLAGAITVNPALPAGNGNFQTIGGAVQLIQNCGMAGNVTVNVSSGIYNEILTFATIPGIGAGSRLSFVGADSATTIITSAGIANNNRATILFNGADNISFSNFKIENTGASNAVAVQVVGFSGNSADSLSFNKCTFVVTSANVSTLINPFEVSSLITSATSQTFINANALTIDSSSFIGGYYGMTLMAPNATRSFGHKITNSYFFDQNWAMMYTVGIERSLFERNRLIAGGRQNATNSYGLWITYAGEGMVVNANQISGQNGGFGIYSMYNTGTANNKVIFSNNMIQIGTAANMAYGLYLFYPGHVVFAHNAINITTGNSIATTFYLFNNNATLYNTVDMINNIFNNPNAGYVGWLGDGSGNQFTLALTGLNWTLNNNVYFGLGAFPYRSNNQITTTFVNWQNNTGIGNDSNSIFLNPNFTSATNLRLTTNPFNNIGRPNPWVAIDIDGNTRSTTTPDVGVSEFNPPANDAGVLSFALPSAPIDTGMKDVRVVVRNYGAANLTSFDVTYITGTTTHTQTYNGIIPPNGTDTVTFNATSGLGATSQQFQYNGGNFVIRAYTASPNTNADADLTNDTLTLNACQGLSGTYTINPNGVGPRNFTSFASAVNALQCGGALAPVVFEVANGTYTEQVALGIIPGASTTNRVVFRSASLNRTNAILTFSPASASTNYIVTFNGTRFVNFEHMTIRNTSASNGRVFQFGLAGAVNSSNIGIRHNIIEGAIVTTTSDANALIFGAAGTNATDINIANNNLINGSMAVSLGGQGIINNYSLRCQIDSNILTNQYYYGIYLTNRADQKIRGNEITSNTASLAGIYILGLSNNSEISYNKLLQPSNYGLYISGHAQYGEVGGGRIYSNSIMVNGGTFSPLFLTGCSDLRVYNNSINTLTTGTSLTMGAITYGGSVASGLFVNASQMYFINNAINAGSSPAFSVTNAAGLAAIQQLDYNVYNTIGATLLFFNGVSHTPANFNVAKGTILGLNDFNSYNANPTFTSTTNLAPLATDANSWVLNGRGIHVFDLTKDMNNNNRSVAVETGAPDIGAYEFTPNVLPAPATAIGTIGYGNTQHFISYGDTVASVVWGFSGTLPTGVTFRYAPGTLISNRASSPNSNATIDTAAHLMDAYWRLDQTGGSGFTYDVRLRYKPLLLGNVPSESDIKLASRMTSGAFSWWFNNGALSFLDTVNNLFGMNFVLDANSFTGTTDIATPLPVKLTSLRAVKQNTNAVLSWITASERNASQFIVERSMDRRSFEVAGSVRATGNSSVSNGYQFTDNNIGRVAMGKTVYYRLRIVDADGKFEYSPMVAVSFEERTRPALNIYPNPFTANVNINVTADADAKANIIVVDLYGKVVAEIACEVVKGDNLITVDTLQHLTPGVYFVKVNAGNSEMVTKLIKE
jgi:parallel beta-helix repeat protein